MFEFLFVIGIVLAFYGYSAMKNPNVWGDQGRDEIKPENWNGYVVHNGQFMMYAGFFLAALAALDVIFDFAGGAEYFFPHRWSQSVQKPPVPRYPW